MISTHLKYNFQKFNNENNNVVIKKILLAKLIQETIQCLTILKSLITIYKFDDFIFNYNYFIFNNGTFYLMSKKTNLLKDVKNQKHKNYVSYQK